MTGGAYTRTYTYRLDRRVNPGKLRQLESLYAEAARVRRYFNQAILTLWQSSGVLPSALNYNDLPTVFRDKLQTTLPTNLQTALLHQLLGQHKSWAANVKNRFTLTIQRTSPLSYQRYLTANGLLASDATAEQQATAVAAFKHQLHWINRLQQWSVPFKEQQAYLFPTKSIEVERYTDQTRLNSINKAHMAAVARGDFDGYFDKLLRALFFAQKLGRPSNATCKEEAQFLDSIMTDYILFGAILGSGKKGTRAHSWGLRSFAYQADIQGFFCIADDLSESIFEWDPKKSLDTVRVRLRKVMDFGGCIPKKTYYFRFSHDVEYVFL